MSETTTKVKTGKVRLSYAKIWHPEAREEGEKPKYSVALIIPKSDTATINLINGAIEAAKEAGKAKWGGKIPKKLKLPLRDGDEEKEGEEYANAYFLNATSASKPGIVKIVNKLLVEVTDEDEVYSGCYARVSLNFYAFDTKGNQGIAVGLNNILKVADGEPLAGKSSAADDFADLVEAGDFDSDDDFLG